MLQACVNNKYQFSGTLVAALLAYVLNMSLLLAVYRYSTTSTYPLQSCTYTRSWNPCESRIRESPGTSWRSRKSKYYLPSCGSVHSNFFLCQALYLKSFKAVEFCLKKWESFALTELGLLYAVIFVISIIVTEHWSFLKYDLSLRSWRFALCLLARVSGCVGSLVWLFGVFLQKQFLIDNINIEDELSSLGLILLSDLI